MPKTKQQRPLDIDMVDLVSVMRDIDPDKTIVFKLFPSGASVLYHEDDCK